MYQNSLLLISGIVYEACTNLVIFVTLAQVHPMPLFKLTQHRISVNVRLSLVIKNVKLTLDASLCMSIKYVYRALAVRTYLVTLQLWFLNRSIAQTCIKFQM